MLTWFLSWVLDTVKTSAEAEMNDDSALRDQLLEAEMRREMGEISDQEFAEIESDLLARIREIKERREGSGPLAFGGGEPLEASPDSTFQIEATVSGDFYDPATAPHTTVVENEPDQGEQIQVMDIEPGDPLTGPSVPSKQPPGSGGAAGSSDAVSSARSRKPASRRVSRRPSHRRSG